LVKEGGGGDNLAVGWQLPNGTLERPIPSNRIIPFAGTPPPPPPTPGNCASGNFAGFLDVANCNTFAGWALDHSNYGRTVQVDIYVDGIKVGFVNADQNRQDLAQAFGNPAAAPHGWTYNVPANASWRNGQNHSITARICGATADLGNCPQTVNCTGGSGGCTPPAAPSISASPSSINSGGIATLSATGCGGTVNWSGGVPSNGASGNSTSVSPTATTSYTATCTVSGCLSANSNAVTITVASGGGCTSGNFNGHFDSGNCGVFNGWALDHNNYGRTVQVEIRVDGVLVATVPADQSRPDLVPAFGTPAAEFHGWWYYPPAGASWRNGTKTVSARICGATSDLNNSPKTVNFTNCRIGVINNESNEKNEGNENNEENGLILSPNPTDGELRYKLWLPEKTTIGIEISDALGRTILRNYQVNEAGQLDKSLNLSHLAAGVYLFNLQTDSKRYTKKVLVVR
jgi:Secretion system C-terminal sorting domain